ncbi:MAG: methyltransferase domain-containing protein [Chloroflexota bacterium]
MTLKERNLWDSTYLRQGRVVNFPAPDPILFEYVPPMFEARPHRALDLACGYGQNAIWLATQGYDTDAVDISHVALRLGHQKAMEQKVRNVNFVVADLDTYELEPGAYDVVVIMRFIKRGLLPDIRAAVRPGGRIIYQAFNTHHLHKQPGFDPEQLFRVGELLGYFADWRILHNTNDNGVSQLAAIKPDEPA